MKYLSETRKHPEQIGSDLFYGSHCVWSGKYINISRQSSWFSHLQLKIQLGMDYPERQKAHVKNNPPGIVDYEPLQKQWSFWNDFKKVVFGLPGIMIPP